MRKSRSMSDDDKEVLRKFHEQDTYKSETVKPQAITMLDNMSPVYWINTAIKIGIPLFIFIDRLGTLEVKAANHSSDKNFRFYKVTYQDKDHWIRVPVLTPLTIYPINQYP